MGRELLFRVTADDCQWDYFRAGGKGGQNQNKRSTGVRVRHQPSGAVGESREERSQLQNRRTAFRRMGESGVFQTWARTTATRLPPITAVVDDHMRDGNLLVEVRQDGRWVKSHT